MFQSSCSHYGIVTSKRAVMLRVLVLSTHHKTTDPKSRMSSRRLASLGHPRPLIRLVRVRLCYPSRRFYGNNPHHTA